MPDFIFDTHCHLNLPELNADPASVVVRAHNANVRKILVPGCDVQTSQNAVLLAEKFLDVVASIGLHPSYVEHLQAGDLERIFALADSEKVVAVGEIGLDYFHCQDEKLREKQRKIFREMLRFAKVKKLPVLIHGRDAVADCITILREEKIKKAVFHCFSGGLDEMHEIVNNGWSLSFTGIITYPKAESLREVVQNVPAESFFLETDAPYLAPQSVRGQINEPAFTLEIAQKVAEIRGMSLEEVVRLTTDNALKFFKLK